MRKSRKAIQAEKRNYIARLSLLLSSDYRSEVEKCDIGRKNITNMRKLHSAVVIQ